MRHFITGTHHTRTQYLSLSFCLVLLIPTLLLTGCSSPHSATQASAFSETAPSTQTFDSSVQISDSSFENTTSSTQTSDSGSKTITLGFAGDINFSEDWPTMQYLKTTPDGLIDCISPELIRLTNSYDLFMPNNEFTYSTRGTAMTGKAYTFRADPSRIEMLKALGTDLVLLANNHVYDYGKDAFLDTLDTLDQAQISYVGAGRTLSDAASPVYFTINGVKIAYVAASRAEKNIMTPQAGENSPGILRTYDPTLFLEEIQTAAANSDYVIANVHWGTEYDNNVNSIQRELADKIIKAGADAIIGTHPHVLQGIEFIDGKPVMYSLGNFWFNEKTLYSCLYELTLTIPDTPDSCVTLSQIRFVPCLQKDCQTTLPEDSATKQKIIDFEQQISIDTKIDSQGVVTPLS